MKPDISRQDAQNLVSSVRWCHKIDLGDGLQTPGAKGEQKLVTLDMPEDLTGWTVLDVGAFDGYFSFEAEKRGAARVLATDWNAWLGVRAGYDWQLKPRKDAFNIARYLLGSNVEDMTISVYDLSPEVVGTFDLVLFLGVLYHLWHPLLALEKLFAVTEKLLIVETAVLNADYPQPVMEFVKDRHSGDPTNWWYPNPACMRDMLLAVGFQEVVELPRERALARRVFHAFRRQR